MSGNQREGVRLGGGSRRTHRPQSGILSSASEGQAGAGQHEGFPGLGAGATSRDRAPSRPRTRVSEGRLLLSLYCSLLSFPRPVFAECLLPRCSCKQERCSPLPTPHSLLLLGVIGALMGHVWGLGCPDLRPYSSSWNHGGFLEEAVVCTQQPEG